MAKLSLKANPTFTADVGIPVAGGEPVKVKFTFKHRTKSALDEWLKARDGRADSELVLDMSDGWDLEDSFNRQNVDTLLENYGGSAIAILRVYVEQLYAAKLGN